MSLEAVNNYEVSPLDFNGFRKERINREIRVDDSLTADNTTTYLREIDGWRLLTREEELDLARQVVQGRLAQDRLLLE